MRFITATAVDGEQIGIPVDNLVLVTEFVGDNQNQPEDGPYSRIWWKDPLNHNQTTWTTIRSEVGHIVTYINRCHCELG